MSVIDELVKNNEAFAAGFDHERQPPSQPARRVAIVACMDARLDPYEVVGLTIGDAHVIRNAGGVITDDEIRSLAISQHLLGTEEIMLIHHTDCGMLNVSNEEFHQLLEAQAGQRPPWHTMSFSDLEEDVRDSIWRIKESPFIPKTDSVRGFIYDIATGRLEEVT
ncbi:MAG TPA: carbonic anhydrase [Solirubrobacterales bacterium]|jgi:carbonic anhydrase